MAVIPIELIMSDKNTNPAIGGLPWIFGKAISPSDTCMVTGLKKNSKARDSDIENGGIFP
jgi:hypothetical protein